MATGTEAYNNSRGTLASRNAPGFCVMYRMMDAAAIIAADATLTAAAKITAGQEITAFELPVGFLVLGGAAYVKTAGTAGGTINFGTYANTTLLDTAFSNATAAAWFCSAAGTDGVGYSGTVLSSSTENYNDVCLEYVADETTGKIVVAIWGIDFSFLTEVA